MANALVRVSPGTEPALQLPDVVLEVVLHLAVKPAERGCKP